MSILSEVLSELKAKKGAAITAFESQTLLGNAISLIEKLEKRVVEQVEHVDHAQRSAVEAQRIAIDRGTKIGELLGSLDRILRTVDRCLPWYARESAALVSDLQFIRATARDGVASDREGEHGLI